MFARVNTAQGKADQVEAGTRIIREKAVPALQKQKGFKGFYSLVDRKSGKTLAISLWESEADLKASETEAGKLRAQVVAEIGAAAPTVDVYEVAIHP